MEVCVMKLKKENALVSLSDAICGIDKMNAAEVIAEIDRLISSINVSKFRLAQLLRRVQIEGWHKKCGYQSFRAFVEDKLRLNFKTSQALIRIERQLIEEAGIQRADVYELGFARALELVPLASAGKITAENRDDVIEEAKKLNVKQLEVYIRTQRHAGGKEEDKSKNNDMTSSEKAGVKKAELIISSPVEAPRLVQGAAKDQEFAEGFDILESCMPTVNGIIRLSFAFHLAEQVNFVKLALEVAKGVIGDKPPSDLLVAICQQFILKYDGSEPGKVAQSGARTSARSHKQRKSAQSLSSVMDPKNLPHPIPGAATAPSEPDDPAVDWPVKPSPPVPPYLRH
jgi:hypothetical protein